MPSRCHLQCLLSSLSSLFTTLAGDLLTMPALAWLDLFPKPTRMFPTQKVQYESHTWGPARMDVANAKDSSHMSAYERRHVVLKGYAVEVTTLPCCPQNTYKGYILSSWSVQSEPTVISTLHGTPPI